jgi:putative hydrolase of HD superfamily
VSPAETAERLAAQFAFLAEADRLKSVLRGTTLHDGSRRENSAEHSWHICLYALTLAEHAERPVNIDRVLRMLLLHDLVEIDAGDAPIHGSHDPAEQARIEQAAADRLFGLLPPDQAAAYRALWEEFEAAETDDAVFAKSVDRVQPVVSNLASGGATWVAYDVTPDQLDARVGAKVRRGAPRLWSHLAPRISAWFAARA